MGFGILFFGYFLFINFAYYTYTDAIAACLVWYALTKLSTVNKNFKIGSYFAAVFTVFGIAELALWAVDSFGLLSLDTVVYSVMATVRYLLIALCSMLTLLGMRDVASEVGLPVIAERCKRLSVTTVIVYAFNILLEVGALGAIFGIKAMVYVSVAMLFATLIILSFNLSQIYSCYAKICMPGQDEQKERPSRFGFVNAFRAHEDEKKKEYLDYRIEKLKKRAEKVKKGKSEDENKK